MRKGSEGEGRRDTSMLHVVALSILPVKKGSKEKKGKGKKREEKVVAVLAVVQRFFVSSVTERQSVRGPFGVSKYIF